MNMNEETIKTGLYLSLSSMSDLQIEIWRQTPECILTLIKYPWVTDLIKDILDERTFEHIQQNYKNIKDDPNNFGLANWDISDVTPDQLTEPHPYQGITHIAYRMPYEHYWIIGLLKGNTWFDLWETSSTLIWFEGLCDHTHIEGFSIDKDNTACLILHVGS